MKRHNNGVPLGPAGTLMVMGNLKEMAPKWVAGVSMLGYGCSLAVGVGIPIPVLNEKIASFTGVSDEEIFTQIIDILLIFFDSPTGLKKAPREDR